MKNGDELEHNDALKTENKHNHKYPKDYEVNINKYIKKNIEMRRI